VSHAPLPLGASPTLTPDDALTISKIAYRDGGLSIAPEKVDFLTARLTRRLAQLGLPDFGAYAALLCSPQGGTEIPTLIEALTTHTTSFFRENLQFEWLRDTGLPELILRGSGQQRELVFWSAACSTGQELYSALMTIAALREADETGLRYRGIGTDLSSAVLRKAKQAIYTGEEIAGIPVMMRRRFLLSARDGKDVHRIASALRQRTRWSQANLVNGGELSWIQADVAMLRNVLIYFDGTTRDKVLENVLRQIRPGGYLLTGHAETIRGGSYGLKSIRPSIYRKDG